MATIIRNGQEIVLTEDELLAIRKEEHRKDIEFDVEQEVEACVDNDWISFDDWTESGQEYKDADDARADFIAYIVEDIIEKEEMYDRAPYGHRADIGSIVADYAVDFGYWKEEN